MSSRTRALAFLAAVLALSFTLVFGQASEAPAATQELMGLYESLQFPKVIQKGKQLLSASGQKLPEELLKIHELMGLSYFHLGKLDSAESHFASVLSINPNYEMDPVLVSPKIIDFFTEIKKDLRRQSPLLKPMTYQKYVFVEDPRPRAAWRSALLPGWGQLYKKHKTKGVVVGGLFFGSLFSTVYSRLKENDAHRRYLDAANPSQIQNDYRNYNKWYKARRTLTAVTVGVWLFSFADALWSPSAAPLMSVTGKHGFLLTYRFSF